MTPLAISLIIVFACLVVGAIGVGVYIAVFKGKPENRNKDPDPAVIALILVTALLVGLLIVAAYFLYTGRECPTCYWGAQDTAALKGAQDTFDALQRKADAIPRDMSYSTTCDADPSGGVCGVRARSPPVR